MKFRIVKHFDAAVGKWKMTSYCLDNPALFSGQNFTEKTFDSEPVEKDWENAVDTCSSAKSAFASKSERVVEI